MKVGDKVKLLENTFTGDEMAPGQTGVIVFVGTDLVEVELDNGYVADDGEPSWPFYPNELEIIE